MNADDATGPVFELTADHDDELIDERVVWHGWDFESVLRPQLARLIDGLDACDDAQCVYIAFSREQGVFVVAWDVWLPKGDGPQCETWYTRATVLSGKHPAVQRVGGLSKARDYGEATNRIEGEFDDLDELVID